MALVVPYNEELVANSPQVESGKKSREIAAATVSISCETYRQAKAVINSGDEDVRAAANCLSMAPTKRLKSHIEPGAGHPTRQPAFTFILYKA